MISRIVLLAVVALLAGCSSMPTSMPFLESKGSQALATGVDDYANGDYPAATKNLRSALDMGLGTREQVKAHKYLAFIDCVTGKTHLCRDEFAKALDVDPDMELEADEAGHPIWGPVFKSVKSKKAATKK